MLYLVLLLQAADVSELSLKGGCFSFLFSSVFPTEQRSYNTKPLDLISIFHRFVCLVSALLLLLAVQLGPSQFSA